MSDVILALVFAIGVGGWLFFTLNGRTGDANASGNLAAGGIAAVVTFIFIFTLLKYVLHF